MRKEIIAISLDQAWNFTHDKPWAAISITDDFDRLPVLTKENQVGLTNEFVDADPGFIPMRKQGKPLFDNNFAQQILDFVPTVWDKIDLMMIHCHAGMCRSPAIGAAISQIYYGDDNDFFNKKIPNEFVYVTLLKKAINDGILKEEALDSEEWDRCKDYDWSTSKYEWPNFYQW